MKRTVFCIIAALLTLVFVMSGCTGVPSGLKSLPAHTEKLVLDPDEWECTFNDDFDTIDRTKWRANVMRYDTEGKTEGLRRAGWYTDDADMLFAEDGKLVMRTKYMDGKYGSGWYTSWLETSTVETKDSLCNYDKDTYEGFSQTYGYFEIRCIAPKTEGIWSAFWLMPDVAGKGMSAGDILGTGEDGIEIDIMESPSLNCAVTPVVHGDGYGKNLKSDKSDSYYVPKMFDEFHTYGFMWTEEEYIFYIDGYEVFRTDHRYIGEDGTERSLGVSRVPEYMILSIEVGGDIIDGKVTPGKVYGDNGEVVDFWAGDPDRNAKDKNYDFVVDHVKVYAKK